MFQSPISVTVSGLWLKACGMGFEAVDMPVHRTQYAPSGDKFYHVTLPNGRSWVVASYHLERGIKHG